MSLRALFWRDLLLARRQAGDWLLPLLFLLTITLLFPLLLGPEAAGLSAVAPAVGWLSVLLAQLLAGERLFREDAEDGCQDLLLLAPVGLYGLIQVRVLVHWLLVGVPLSLLAALAALLLYLPAQVIGVLIVALLLGTLVFSHLGALGAALTVSLSRGSLLMVFLVLPLFVPVLIFGASALQYAVEGWPVLSPLALLAALACLSASLAPLAVALILRTVSD